LLKKLPHYVQGKIDDFAFAHKLEHMYGPAANGAFAVEEGLIVLKGATGGGRGLKSETFDCLTNALWASGLALGFSGTEYYRSNE
jgi:hypothetical protein